MTKHSTIGDLLIREGLIDSSGLDRVLEIRSKREMSLSKVLAALGLADEKPVAPRRLAARVKALLARSKGRLFTKSR